MTHFQNFDSSDWWTVPTLPIRKETSTPENPKVLGEVFVTSKKRTINPQTEFAKQQAGVNKPSGKKFPTLLIVIGVVLIGGITFFALKKK